MFNYFKKEVFMEKELKILNNNSGDDDGDDVVLHPGTGY